mmetsp:Transcript_54518/g.145484  ORF Transcript_54518/g.145484 Transcript_54518/m.145484 type:complete len:205 (+) Transcript_54518:49-663(+)
MHTTVTTSTPSGGKRPHNLEGTTETLINVHDRTSVVELAAVVWSTEQCDKCATGKEFVAILHNLVGSADEVQPMLPEEALHDVGAESKGDTPVVLTPPTDLLLRVGPQQIAQKSCVWDVGWLHNALDLLQTVQLWRQTTMHAENLLVNNRTHRKAVETICEGFPESNAVAALTLVVESIDSVDRRALVVAPEQEEILRVLHLEC